MLLGRTEELKSLEEMYEGDKSTLTIMYGRSNIGKTEIIKEFCKNKKCVYYLAPQASSKEQVNIFREQLALQTEVLFDDGDMRFNESYMALLPLVKNIEAPVKLLIIDEFQNIVKNNDEFMNAVTSLVKGEAISAKVMVICISSSISWIENNLVSAIGNNAYTISAFLKVKELSFIDTVRMFSKYSVPDCLRLYAITGGVPGYMKRFDDSISLKDNICRQLLENGAYLRDEGSNYIKEELRETSLYNTILYCIANGEFKLNELHEHTGFGRDKISVYLKNLIEREIVEKVFSFDSSGAEHTRKGLYKIKTSIVEFWFRFIYSNQSSLNIMKPEEFYDKYIAMDLDDFAADTFTKIGTEFIELMDSMDRLQIKIDRRGRWWGKNGNIDIVACDKNKKYVIGKCNWFNEVFSYEAFEDLLYNANLAGVGADYIYLFSKGTFDERLNKYSKENPNVILIGIDDL